MIGDYYNVKTITMFEVIYVFISGRNRSEQLHVVQDETRLYAAALLSSESGHSACYYFGSMLTL